MPSHFVALLFLASLAQSFAEQRMSIKHPPAVSDDRFPITSITSAQPAGWP